MINFFEFFKKKEKKIAGKFENFLKNLSINRVDAVREFPEVDIDKPFNAYVTLAILLREKGEFHKAVQILETLYKEELSEDDEKLLLLNLAITYKQAGFIDRAEKIIKEGIEKFPSEGFFYYELAKLNQLYGNWEEAVKNLQIANSLTDLFSEELFYAKLSFINFLLDKGEIDRAFKIIKTLRNITLIPYFYYTLARIYFDIGDRDRGYRNLITGMRLSEKQTDVFLELFSKYEDLTVEVLEHLIDRVGLNFSLGILYAKKLEEIGEEEKALEVVNEISRKYPLKAEVKELQLRLMWNLGKRKQVVDVILSSLEQLKRERKKYICENCGYKTDTFEWNCPKCRTWESLRLNIE